MTQWEKHTETCYCIFWLPWNQVKPYFGSQTDWNQNYSHNFCAQYHPYGATCGCISIRRIKIGWAKHLQEFTRNNPMVPANANNFPKIFIPFLLHSLSESGKAIANRFRITGLFPFQHDRCNMSKLQVSAARSSFVNPCESMDGHW